MSPKIIAIYAVSENGVIGKDNDLPWSLPDDMRHFMRSTKGKTVVMGRKSFESIDCKPLPKRRNIIITRQQDYVAPGAEVVHSLEEAIELAKADGEIWITGGAGVYEESIEKGYVDIIYETLVHAEVDGDVQFRFPNREKWEITDVDARQADDKNEFAFTIRTLTPKA
ncbi:MAG: dihydrofolate reductase [Bacteroidota bacterium]